MFIRNIELENPFVIIDENITEAAPQFTLIEEYDIDIKAGANRTRCWPTFLPFTHVGQTKKLSKQTGPTC